MPESSVIIPVYNKWDLTRKCLKSLAANTPGKIEVIVVDNASTDATQRGCGFLGRQLFGEDFRYIRNDVNRNFAGASNQGAEAARGEFLVFLNNDTEAQPGWYEPLIEDFTTYPDIAATGPLLVYPDETPLGRTVQHLGILVTPFMTLGHLHDGIPESSPLTRKRRFFQAITGACMVIRRSLFMDVGRFDEGFVNGFEDVDLCARLWDRGMRMTVNPDSLVVHHESQTPGRHEHEEENSERLLDGSLKLIGPDWHVHLKNDGLFLDVDPWLKFQPSERGPVSTRLDAMAAHADQEAIGRMLVAHPYWENGWRTLISRTGDPNRRFALFRMYHRLFKNPRTSLEAMRLGRESGDSAMVHEGISSLRGYCDPPDEALVKARAAQKWCGRFGMPDLAGRYADWIEAFPNWSAKFFAPLADGLADFARENRMALNPYDSRLYGMWVHATGEIPPANGTKFSVLMPVFNPRPEHLRAALDSVLAQTHPHWELCVADDASTDPETGKIIDEYAARDPRIRVVRRERNGHIAAATNTALEMAEMPWCALMDQDDVLVPDALARMADAIAKSPDGMLFWSDEDKTDDSGAIFNPHLKNGRFDHELLPAQNFVCHLAVYRTDRLREIGGFREGFPGSQDHDLLLRYADGIEDGRAVHVPHVLYHWRAHEQSTASSSASKAYSVGSAVRAAQDWLDHAHPGAVSEQVPGRVWLRVRWPIPKEQPTVTLVVRGAVPEIPGGWPHEIVRAREISEINDAVAKAKGEIVGFVGGGVAPAGGDWLREIAGNAIRPEIGAVGGKVAYGDGRFVHGGYLTDGDGLPKPLFAGAANPRWFGWEILSRTVDALDGLCLFTRRDTFLDSGGLDSNMGEWAFQDYCMRLGQRGLRSIWVPFAVFTAGDGVRPTPPTAEFAARWRGVLPPFNRNLRIDGGGLSLCTG